MTADPLAALRQRVAALSPERGRLLLRELRAAGVAAPMTLREPANALTSMPDLTAEAFLDPLIRPATHPPERRPRAVFLTGATGFLGGFLLEELLRETEVRVVCLVRGENEAGARERLRSNLRRLELPDRSQDRRIQLVLGDLTRALFGLRPAVFASLAAETDAVLHSGAFVNFLAGYDACLAPNVIGTQEALRLACAGHPKPFQFVSTLTFFMIADQATQTPIPEEPSLGPATAPLGGYGQSKWVSEALVWEAHARGLPVTVHRPGLVMGHSQTGVANLDDIFCRSFLGSARLGGKALESGANVEVVPVDHVCQTVVHALRTGEGRGQAIHLMSRHPAPLFPIELMRAEGLSVEPVDIRQWLRHLETEVQADTANPLQPLVPYFLTRWPSRGLRLDEILTSRPRVLGGDVSRVLPTFRGQAPPWEAVAAATMRWLRRRAPSSLPLAGNPRGAGD